jgi:uncharacterized protein
MRIALAAAFCLASLVMVAPLGARLALAKDASPESSAQGSHAQPPDNVVTIMAASAGGTDLAIAEDLAAVLSDGTLRVVPMVGVGPAQNIKDVMSMRGVDMGITQASILKYYDRTGELGAHFKDHITYVSKLFNEELHLLARGDVRDIQALRGQKVNVGLEGSGTDITARFVFGSLGIEIEEVHLGEAEALQKLRTGEIAASMIVAGKPAPTLAALGDASGLKLIGLPYGKDFEDAYYPATLTHDDYPALIPDGQRVDTLSVCAVLVTFNWDNDGERYRKLAAFVDRFLSNFESFLVAPRHPKWREVNFAATLEGWQRSPAAQAFIDRTRQVAAAPSQSRFEAFLATKTASGSLPASEEERASLFRDFLEWSKSQGND